MTARPKQFLIPASVDAVIDNLLDAGRREGNRVSRSDVVGALIWQGRHLDGDSLGVIVRTYRRESMAATASPTGRLAPGPRLYTERAQP